jgi:PAS domain S-box-containing protein
MGKEEDRLSALKDMIQELHAGKGPQEVKAKFKQLLARVSPEEIAKIEEKLIEEGMPREEVRRLCDVHLAVFQESLDKQKVDVQRGHPLHTFMEEHKIFSQDAERLQAVTQKLKQTDDLRAAREEMNHLKEITQHLMEKESHNVREENVLFSYLEKHGITEPPAIMWTEHNEMREKMKKLSGLMESAPQDDFSKFACSLETLAMEIGESLSNHIYKENNILYPAALKAIAQEEWPRIRRECDQLGYSVFTPECLESAGQAAPKGSGAIPEGLMALEPGPLSLRELEALLDSLPVDISFVDHEDKVRYFNQPKERIFPRTKAVIGRSVQKCHPQKSVHVVNQILDDFRNGRRDEAEFWIQMGGRLVHIRYFPVLDKQGNYLGCLEVTQDITDIKKIEGEKRLL